MEAVKRIAVFLLGSLFLFGLYGQEEKIDLDALSAAENLRWGVQAYHRGYYNSAVNYLEEALSYQPGSERVKFWLGKSFYKSGYEEAALNEWQKILDAGNKDPFITNYIQVVSMRRGIGEEILEEERMVLTRELDASKEGYHPFRRPTSIRPKRDGSLFLVAYGSNEIISINANGLVTDILKGGLAIYNHPFDVLQAEDGTLYITEYESDVVAICKPNGDRIKTFGGKGTGEGKFLGPQFLAMDSSGFLYVTDWGNRRVSKFTTDGVFVSQFGYLGEKDSRLSGPSGIVILSDRVIVSDSIKKVLFVFDLQGNFIKKIGEGFLQGPEGLFIKDENTLFVAETFPLKRSSNILELDLLKERFSVRYDISGEAGRLLSLAVGANKNLYAADYDKNKVYILSRMSDLYSGLFVQIERIESVNFPEIMVDLSVQDRYGNPVVGLEPQNFLLTEERKAISNFELYNPVFLQEAMDIVILVEKSLVMKQKQAVLEKCAGDLLNILGMNRDFSVVTAGEEPSVVLENRGSAPRGVMETVKKLSDGGYSNKWSIDRGIRIAGSHLLASRNKRMIIYITTGVSGWDAFKNYSLMESTQFLKNNHIGFHVIYLGPDSGNAEFLTDDIRYLAEKSGGKVYNYLQPEGILSILKDIRKQSDPRYILKYDSITYPEFGTRYIETGIEVNLNKASGKDFLGYYAPLE